MGVHRAGAFAEFLAGVDFGQGSGFVPVLEENTVDVEAASFALASSTAPALSKKP